MTSLGRLRSLLSLLGAIAASLAIGACSADAGGALESENLTGADEGSSVEGVTQSFPVGSVLAATAGLNLRSGPGTGYRVLLVIPSGGRATLLQSAPSHGWYKIKYSGTTGWAYGAYLRLVTGSSTPATSSTPVTAAIERARSGVGFSYWWGGGRWLASGATSSNRGVCRGNCPSCSHSGSYGADCSGYVAKIWQVPASNDNVAVYSHPYSTYHFYSTTGSGRWSTVTRSQARRGDAYVYNSNGAGHIFLYESGDPWGSIWAYEARGCSYGIVHNLRTASSGYKVIRRAGY